MTVKATDEGVVMEGKLDEALAKDVLEGMAKLFTELNQPRGKP